MATAQGPRPVRGHIALVGDSIFDNRAYTSGEPDVTTHLRARLPAGWRATLLALDGSTIADVPRQLAGVEPDVTHVVVSAGGNDALLESGVLAERAASVADALRAIGERAARFERAYRALVDRVLSLGRRTILCTIYNGNFQDDWGRTARLGLTLFNDPILRIAFERPVDVVDLRLVCAEPQDYANPIEPSGTGGRRIAAAVAAATGVDGNGAHSRVFGR